MVDTADWQDDRRWIYGRDRQMANMKLRSFHNVLREDQIDTLLKVRDTIGFGDCDGRVSREIWKAFLRI